MFLSKERFGMEEVMAIVESDFTLTDLIDVEALQKIQDAFSDMSALPL